MGGQVSLQSMVTPTIQAANLGMADSLILMVLALVVFGPRRLPQIGRQLGKLMYEFRKASNDFKFQMEEELRNAEEADRRQQEEERLRALALAAPAPATEAGTDTVSQASEVKPEAPWVSGEIAATAEATTNESPYPEEGQYPELTASGTDQQPGEAYPRIQPPTTGEQVPAERPASSVMRTETEQESGAASSPESSLETRHDANAETAAKTAAPADDAQPEQPASAPEPVNHNG
jgi:sec-independent protein translocase protein TatB